MGKMSQLAADFGTLTLVAAFAVMLFAGFVKGTVGFALPMLTISGVGSLLSAELAIAAIILPGLLTNMMQAFRNGFAAAVLTLRTYWLLNLILFCLIGIFAQVVVLLPDWALFLILGSMVTFFATLQLSGWIPSCPDRLARRFEALAGVLAGFFGGLAGVWGPPILLYLLSRDTPKVEVVRAQGISFLIGSFVLFFAHLKSGLLSGPALPFSAWMVLPAVAGMVSGMWVQDRLDQKRFRTLALLVLVVAGLNLIRRGLAGIG